MERIALAPARPERVAPLLHPMVKPLNLIVACSENLVIGRDRRLPWSIPEDLRHFHDLTAGNVCVLGRVCFENWPSVCADGRQPVVITRDDSLATDRVHVAGNLLEALAIADGLSGEIMICGGTRIYEETLALAGKRPLRLILTLIHAQVPGDTLMPEWRHLPWREISRRESADANYRYTFSVLEC